tara:strand:- start:265 stop:465 length:201 start_codon:yes stop_codon:yes gene_type:complete
MILQNDIFNEELKRIRYDRQFVLDCIESCTTPMQKVNALNLVNNFYAKWSKSLYLEFFTLPDLETL